jgi:predicted PurR-regulated permease PerM
MAPPSTSRPSGASNASGGAAGGFDWRRQRDIGFAVIAWIVIAGIALWAISHVIGTVLLYLLAGILAYAIAPAVRPLARVMPRGLAIAVVYLVLLVVLVALLFLIGVAAMGEASAVIDALLSFTRPGSHGEPSRLYLALKQLGLSDSQIQTWLRYVTDYLQNASGSAVTVGERILSAIFDAMLVGIISVYFVADGTRFGRWLISNAPTHQQPRISFFVTTLNHVIGGYIRGQLLLSLLISVLVGVGMGLLRVPHPLFLAAVAFVFEFVPMIGLWIVGAVCVLVALTESPALALVVAGYIALASAFEGNIASPRILGRAVDVHPVVSLFALLAGAELFGLWGAVFAAPAAGLAQALFSAFWKSWRAAHPADFAGGTGGAEVDVAAARPGTDARGPARVVDGATEHAGAEPADGPSGAEPGEVAK